MWPTVPLPVEEIGYRAAAAAPADPASAASADGIRSRPLSAHVLGDHHFLRECHVELLLRQVAVVTRRRGKFE